MWLFSRRPSLTTEYSAFGSKRVRGAGGWAGGRVEVAGKLTPGSGWVHLVGVLCSLGQVGVLCTAAWVQEGVDYHLPDTGCIFIF